ncbi:hypothetical protein RSK20926_08752 [Roseobacter sp. SK209-2-6]|uniref:DUF1761 domain-containing protein n=1 Tax=Roseobacter sp. SK209-2-6 TaxID=388739 RepID=UPI0000F3D39B|nr:DUF1761 domain-containing protein [Roseobacter sp. SK209-2-6]EBA17046.1 hypothetical protein RSK20926_08752 [Roseobacter sp. SK209-2-6]
MEFLNVLVAAAAGFALGAVYYGILANPWMEAANIKRGTDGKPEGGQSPALFAATFALQLVVAGMMRHVFSLSGIDTSGAGLVAGLGVGLFFISPWIAINNLYAGRPLRLTLIDGGYASLACALIGLVLCLF